MTVYNKASLVLAESPAYKAGKIQPYYPLTPDVSFDFTRATSATRVNASGNIEKETQNLLTYSNTLTNGVWSKAGTLTSGQSDKDGGTDAYSFTSSSPTSGLHRSFSTGGVQTFSAYFKKDATNGVRMYAFGSTNAAVFFDLNNGAVVSEQNVIDAKIEAYNSTWWRASITFNSTLTLLYFYATNNGTTQVTGTFTIQDIQLEQGLVARDYIETTTTAFYGGITDNIPRLDYTDSSCPALLLEPQRTNLILNSEGADKITSSTTSYTFNEIVSPDGYRNSIKIETLTAGSYRSISWGISLSAGAHTFSCYLKAGTSPYIGLFHIGTGLGWIDTSDFTKSSGSLNFDIENFGNGWYKIHYTITATAGNNAFYIFNANGNSQTNSDVGDNFYGYGFQVEEGSYPTSYIPTYGTSVTRNSEQIISPSTSYDLSGSFSIFFDFGKTRKTAAGSIYFYWLDTNANDFFLYTNSSGTDGLNVYLPNQGGYVFGSAANDAWNADASKICVTYNATTGRLAYFINGSKYNEQTSVLSFTGNNVDSSIEAGSNNIAEIKKYMFFTQALTDDECIALTTL